jgi:polygalacturonase
MIARRRFAFLAFVLTLTIHTAPALAADPSSVFPVRAFGARGDGAAKDTAAIQKAIDAAAERGGTVYFAAGAYLSGTLILKSAVALHLDSGAVLLGSTDIADYPNLIPRYRSYTDNYVKQSLLYGEDVHDVAITGRGAIDGQGAAFKSRTYENRPYVLRLITSRDILVENVTMRNSPMWMQHYLACDNVVIRGITVHDRVNANNDMIDIDCCRNVRISDCFGESDDDAITLKSTADRATENVAITNCVVSSTCNGIKMGTESNGGFKNITISNCTVFNTRLAGLALEMVDGGALEGIAVSNLTMRNVGTPIFLRLGNRARPFQEGNRPGMGTFRDVVISNVVAEGAGRVASSITGLPGHPVRDVTLSNIRIVTAGGGTEEDAAREVPEKPEAYPEHRMFGALPAYGFYCRHVEGLRMENIDVRCEKEDRRPALVCDDVKALDLAAFRGLNASSAATSTSTARLASTATAPPASGLASQPLLLRFRDVQGALVRNCVAPTATGVFLRLEGKSARVSATGNDLTNARTPFAFAQGTPASVLFHAANREKE